uniref:Uncharacterized protein n=1 Tax=Musa acuminata subsp. malaccensis TaxID=214687 RepID=A0A804I8L7_MUSAM
MSYLAWQMRMCLNRIESNLLICCLRPLTKIIGPMASKKDRNI